MKEHLTTNLQETATKSPYHCYAITTKSASGSDGVWTPCRVEFPSRLGLSHELVSSVRLFSKLFPLPTKSQESGSLASRRSSALPKTILEVKHSVPSGTKPAGGFHTRVLTDTTEDTDVFHVLRQTPPLPEFVGTKNGNYMVETEGTIKRVK